MTTHEITSFKIHQFKGVRATVEILPNGPGLIVVAGPNGSGKSSVVDGIMQIVAPAGVAGIPKPINDGKDSAYIEMTTTQAVARRDYPKDGPGTLSVRALDGAKYPSGKAFMLDVTGGQVFDTAQFAGLAEKDQRAELLRRVDLPFDVDALDADRKALFDTRTDMTREVKKLTAQLAGFAPHDKSLPDSEVSVSDLMGKANAATQHNLARRQAALWAIDRSEAVERARVDLADAAAALAEAERESSGAIEEAESFDPEIDTTALAAEMEGIDATNAKVRAQLARTGVASDLEDSTDAETALTADIKAIDKTKLDGLSTAKFPVVGLGIDDTGITFDGIPFRQVNPAQQIIVAFDLATVNQPDLRIVFIKNGDLLDNTSLAGIEQLAIKRGYYVVVERDRDNSGAIGWTMIEGALTK